MKVRRAGFPWQICRAILIILSLDYAGDNFYSDFYFTDMLL